MKNVLLLSYALICFAAANAQTAGYSSFGGNEKSFNDKYKLTAELKEPGKKLVITTTAPVARIVLSTYTEAEMAVRKGTDHEQKFTQWPGSFTYDLSTAANKDKFAYWLKVYTTDGLFTEYIYRQQKKEPAATQPKEEAKKPAKQETKKPVTIPANEGTQEEVKTDDGATLIKTSITCKQGSEKVEAALRELEGVNDVKIDITTGKLSIWYSSDGTPFISILATIRDNGFDANGQKATKPAANPCKAKHSKD